MSAVGLKRFAKSGTNVDMELVELYFDNDQIIRQLEYIRDNLEGAGEPGKQHFYLVNSGIVQVDKAILIFEGYRVAMTFNEINYPALYHRALLDEKVSRTFYRYVTESLLSEERRSKADSPIMSYKMAKEFIDGLIKMRRESAS